MSQRIGAASFKTIFSVNILDFRSREKFDVTLISSDYPTSSHGIQFLAVNDLGRLTQWVLYLAPGRRIPHDKSL
jgi:hypothetical protein